MEKKESIDDLVNQIKEDNRNIDQEWIDGDDSIEIEDKVDELIKQTENMKFEFSFSAEEIRKINRGDLEKV